MAAEIPEAIPVPRAVTDGQDDEVDEEALFQQLVHLRDSKPEALEELYKRVFGHRRRKSFTGKPAESPWAGSGAVDGLLGNAEEYAVWERQESALEPSGTGEFGVLPLKRSPSGVKIDIRKMKQLREEQMEHKWNIQPVAVAFEGLKVFKTQKDDVMPSVSRALTAPCRGCCAQKGGSVQHLGHGSGVSGYVKPGEMLLVLGPPSSGCSTLLKTLAGQTQGSTVEATRLMYNGHRTIGEAGGRAIYLSEDDLHNAPLSVEKTFQFAAEMGTPDEYRTPDMTRDKLNKMVVQLVLHLLSLDHVKSTVVGNDLLRGVSGGEKKRVSIGEVVLMRSSLICLDGWSRGLDSAATLRICRHLRTLANLFKFSIVVSMYQVGPEMLAAGKGFDNVLILSKGRQLFFGPTAQAERYFKKQGIERPPRRTLPDFLSTVVDAAVQQSTTGFTRAMSADDPVALANEERFCDNIANRWTESSELDKVRQDLRGTGGVDVLPGSHLQGVSYARIERNDDFVARPEPTSISNQIKMLLWREWELTMAFKKQYIHARFGRFVFLSLLQGLAFLNLDNSTSGAYSRMGCIYNTMLNLGLGSFAAMPDIVQQRNILYKQKEYAMIRPWAWYLAKFIFDIPFTIIETIIFGGILYYMVGFNGSAGHFFTWLCLLWAVDISSAAMIRLFSSLAPDLEMAQALSAGVLIIFVFFCGFMLPRDSIPVYYKWCYYMSPFSYGLHGLLVNEYYGLKLECDDPVVIAGQSICTLEPTGDEYIKNKLDIDGDKAWIWYDFMILMGFTVLFVFLTCVALTKLTFAPSGSSLRFKQGVRHSTATSAPADQEVQEVHVPLVRRSQAVVKTQLRWDKVTYSVVDNENPSGDRKVLLHEISGFANPGEMTALMGPSGAGKTTLMDVLALRKDMSNVQGSIQINGKELSPDMVRTIGYVEQQDMHEPRTTVREALVFSAKLRLADGDPVAKADEVIALLGLEDVQHAMIGNPAMGGLSLEARKRVTIGVELVAEPRVLFMDEPTSGLDTAGALAVLRCARAVADSGRTVVMTIHQPSTELFEMFDALCLLQKGGRTAYFGRLHAKDESAGSAAMLSYFGRNAPGEDRRYAYDDTQNPADFMLNVLGYAREHWTDIWPLTQEAQSVVKVLEVESDADAIEPPAPAPCLRQTTELLARTARVFWRTPNYNVTRNIFALFTGLLLGSSYWNLGNTQKDLHNYVTVIYFSVILGVINVMNALPTVILGRPVFYREVASGTYTQGVYSFAMAVVETPFFAMSAALFVCSCFWMCDLSHDSAVFWYYAFMYFLFVAFTVYYGQLMGAAAPSIMVAQMAIPVTMGLWLLFNGFLIREDDIPDYFKIFNIVNPYTYFLRSMVSNVLNDKVFTCSDDEGIPVPLNESLSWSCNPDVLNNSHVMHYDYAQKACLFCPIVSGNEFLSFYGWHHSDIWADLARMAAFVASARIGCTLLLIFKRHIQR
eukprot:Hpha_TRINITY_DN14037_c0_g1::TRINITY_DN14037_c0_g1_i1::g.44019::m.44019